MDVIFAVALFILCVNINDILNTTTFVLRMFLSSYMFRQSLASSFAYLLRKVLTLLLWYKRFGVKNYLNIDTSNN